MLQTPASIFGSLSSMLTKPNDIASVSNPFAASTDHCRNRTESRLQFWLSPWGRDLHGAMKGLRKVCKSAPRCSLNVLWAPSDLRSKSRPPRSLAYQMNKHHDRGRRTHLGQNLKSLLPFGKHTKNHDRRSALLFKAGGGFQASRSSAWRS